MPNTDCMRRVGLLILATSLVFWAVERSGAAEFPTKPIQLIVTYAPGGVTDVVGRLISERSQEFLRQPMVVLNKPGAGGTLGMDFLAKSKPDGHTIGVSATATLTIAPAINPNLPYDPAKAFTYICRQSILSLVIMVRADSQLNTLEKLIDYAKKNPDKLTYGSSGVGTALHLGGELLNRATGIKMIHVPFKGGAPALIALLGGHIDLFVSNYIDAAEQVKAGKVLPLVVLSGQRLGDIPNVPTIAEKGYREATITPWLGINGPAGVPAPIVERISEFVSKVQSIPEVQKKMTTLGVNPAHLGPKEFEKFSREQFVKIKELAKAANIKLE